MKPTHCIASLLVAASAFSVQAQDDLAARRAAADRYVEVMPIAPIVEDSIAKLAVLRPPGQRRDFVGKMHVLFDRKAVALAVRDVMANTFTLEELQALNAFYQTKHGAAIAQKMPAYNAALTPVLLEELLRAGSRYDDAVQGRR